MTNAKPSTRTSTGAALADFTLPSLDGEPVSLSDFRGHKLVIFMWASW